MEIAYIKKEADEFVSLFSFLYYTGRIVVIAEDSVPLRFTPAPPNVSCVV